MYRSLPAAEIALEAAQPELRADRERFYPLYRAMERVLEERGMVVGGALGAARLLGECPDPPGPWLVFSSESALADARELAAAVYEAAPAGLGRYAQLSTTVARKEFSLMADERELARILAPPHHAGRAVRGCLPSVTLPAPFGAGVRLKYLAESPQLQLTYAALCNPAEAPRWPRLLEQEAELRRRLCSSGTGEGGAAGDGAAEGGAPAAAAALQAAFVRDYLPDAGRVLLSPDGAPRPRVATSHDLAQERSALAAIARAHGLPFEGEAYEVRLPGDTQMRRMIAYYRPPGQKRVAVLDVYDAGVRELIPTEDAAGPSVGGRARSPRRRAAGPPRNGSPSRGGVRRGTLFARQRFCLVELWTVDLLACTGGLDPAVAARRRAACLAEVRGLAGEYARALAAGATEALLPARPAAYVGRAENPVLAVKRRRRDQKERFGPYYPCRRKTEGGDLSDESAWSSGDEAGYA